MFDRKCPLDHSRTLPFRGQEIRPFSREKIRMRTLCKSGFPRFREKKNHGELSSGTSRSKRSTSIPCKSFQSGESAVLTGGTNYDNDYHIQKMGLVRGIDKLRHHNYDTRCHMKQSIILTPVLRDCLEHFKKRSGDCPREFCPVPPPQKRNVRDFSGALRPSFF